LAKYQRQFGIPFSRVHEDKDLPYLVPIRPSLLLGVVGLKLAGKRRFTDYLVEEQGFSAYSLARILRDMAAAAGIPLVARPTLQDFGDELRRRRGRDFLAREVAKAIYRDWVEHGQLATEIVIAGIKNLAEVKALRRFPGFCLVAVKATDESRYQRALGDGSFSGSIDEWREKIDGRDLQRKDKFGQQVGLCIQSADLVIENDGTVADFLRQCMTALQEARAKATKRG